MLKKPGESESESESESAPLGSGLNWFFTGGSQSSAHCCYG